MRDIKFRGKRIDNGEWVYGFYVKDPRGEHRIYWCPFEGATNNTYHFVDYETVGEYTDLKDKNDKEIYEGDVLFGREEGDGETTAWTYVYYIVFYKDGAFRTREPKTKEDSDWCYFLDDDIKDEYEVIGNVHENPELLEK